LLCGYLKVLDYVLVYSDLHEGQIGAIWCSVKFKMAITEKYGIKFPSEANDLNIELSCYRNPQAFDTGKKVEFHFRKAFDIVWPNFKWNDWMELMCWAWCNYKVTGVIGHSRGSKTYGFAHFVLLDYLAAPQMTATTLTTTKFDALKTRMWGDLMRAIDSSKQKDFINQSFKVTSTTNEMSMKQRGNLAEDKFMIQGVATDSGDKSAGKIRGQHANRRRILVDEAQDVPASIYVAFLNAVSAPDFKGALLTNPVEKISELGDWVKPKGGWGSIHDTDLFWETEKPHGVCIHLDGLQSPNIKAGRTVFPFLLTQDYVDTVRAAKGEDSLEWWMYVRGFFPPDGMVAKIWPSATLERAMPSVTFDFKPLPFGTLDPAFDSDNCVVHFGDIGQNRDRSYCGCFRESMVIKVSVGPDKPEKDFQVARECIRLCKDRGVEPENFIMDTTGNARGVFAIMRNEWHPKPGANQVQSCYYGGEATDRPLRSDDPLGAKDQVRYFVAELWFRASYMARDGMIKGLGNLDPRTIDDLNTRRYTIKQTGDRKLMQAETKDEMKKRLGRSPDFGDAACQLAELMVRKGMIKGGATKSQGDMWAQMKHRARKAQNRFAKEFIDNGSL